VTGAGRALADLDVLLSRYEANPTSNRLALNPKRADFGTQGELEEYLEALGNAATNGALQIEPRKGRERHSPPRIRLIDPGKLYAFLGREPSVSVADAAIAPVLSGVEDEWLLAALNEVATAWGRGRDWWGIGPDDASRIGTIVRLASVIARDGHHGMDYRTLSVQVVGDSKFLERHEGPLVRFLSYFRKLPAGTPRSILSSLGLDRIAVPFHLSGPIAIGGNPVPKSIPYLALPHSSVGELAFSKAPRCLLTIENFVSFHRHALEANAEKNDLVVYTGGQPSLSWQQSIVALRSMLPSDLPAFHWSDIDAGGLEIFRKVEALLGDVRPHLMSREIADEHGIVPPSPVTRPGQYADSAIGDLGDYLATADGRCLEQESLEPRPPLSD
jgi:hypothetical protein